MKEVNHLSFQNELIITKQLFFIPKRITAAVLHSKVYFVQPVVSAACKVKYKNNLW